MVAKAVGCSIYKRTKIRLENLENQIAIQPQVEDRMNMLNITELVDGAIIIIREWMKNELIIS